MALWTVMESVSWFSSPSESLLLSAPFRWTPVCFCVLPAGECVRGIWALEAAPEPPVPVRSSHGEAPHSLHQPHLHPVPPAWWDPRWLLRRHCLPRQLPHQHLTGEQSFWLSWCRCGSELRQQYVFCFLLFFHDPKMFIFQFPSLGIFPGFLSLTQLCFYARNFLSVPRSPYTSSPVCLTVGYLDLNSFHCFGLLSLKQLFFLPVAMNCYNPVKQSFEVFYSQFFILQLLRSHLSIKITLISCSNKMCQFLQRFYDRKSEICF